MEKDVPDRQQLIKKLKLFEAIVNRSQDGIVVFNHLFEVIFANKTAGHILRVEPAKLRGKSLSDFIPQSVRSKHEKLASLFSYSDQNRQELYDWRGIQCCRADGSLFPAKITVDKFIISGAHIFIVSLADMTDINNVAREKWEAEINHFHVEQQKKYAVGTLHKNIDQSITRIAKSAQTIRDNVDIKPVKEAMGGIMKNAFAALSLSQRAIFISQITKNESELNLVDKSLYGSFERIRSIIEDIVANKEIKIAWDIPGNTKDYKVKKCQILEQIFYNIIEDSLNGLENNEITVQLSQIGETEKGKINLEFYCRNSRYGIAQPIMDQVLSAPSVAELPKKNNLKYDGMCLRLARHLIEQFGGNMRVVSHPVVGTEVFVKLSVAAQGVTKKDQDEVKELDTVSADKEDTKRLQVPGEDKQKILAMRRKAS